MSPTPRLGASGKCNGLDSFFDSKNTVSPRSHLHSSPRESDVAAQACAQRARVRGELGRSGRSGRGGRTVTRSWVVAAASCRRSRLPAHVYTCVTNFKKHNGVMTRADGHRR